MHKELVKYSIITITFNVTTRLKRDIEKIRILEILISSEKVID